MIPLIHFLTLDLQAAAIMLYTQVCLCARFHFEGTTHLLSSPNLRFRRHFAQMPQLQETCLYPRLNEALRNHDTRSLEPFLPFMKLLLSGLYRLPLVHGRTYRGVKLELFKVVAQTNSLHFRRISLCDALRPYISPPTYAPCSLVSLCARQ